MLGKEWGRNLRGMVGALLIVGCSLIAMAVVIILGRNNLPASTQTPPIYPRAQQVTIRDTHQLLRGTIEQTYKITSFQTGDSIATVRAFYVDALNGEGWRPSEQAPDSNTQRFLWFTSSNPPTMYTFEITTKARADGGTDVEIKLNLAPGL